MKAISKFAKRFQRKKQNDNFISVLVASEENRSEDVAEETTECDDSVVELLSYDDNEHSACETESISTSELETNKPQQEIAAGTETKEAIYPQGQSTPPSQGDKETQDNSIQSLTITPPSNETRPCVEEGQSVHQQNQQGQVEENETCTKVLASSPHQAESIHLVERKLSNASVSQITNESNRMDNACMEHSCSSGHSEESPDTSHLSEKKAKRRGRKTDLQAETNIDKSHLSRKETQTTDLTKKKSKNAMEAPASPVSFTRYPWEEPGYTEGAGMSQTLSEAELTREASDWLTILATLETEWTHRVTVLKRIRWIVVMALKCNCQNVMETFSNASMRNALILQTTDLRSSLVKEAFETIATICEHLGNSKDFFLTSALFLEKAVLSAVVKTTKVIAKPAEDCGKRIVASTAAEAVLPVLCSTIRFGVHPTAREKCTTLVLHILKRGPPLIRNAADISFLIAKGQANETRPKEIQGLQYSISEFTSEDSGLRSLESALASAIGDSHGSTREAGLHCLHEIEKHWPERTQGLVQALDPSLRRRAISSLSSNSSQSTRSSAASSNRVRKSVKEWKADAQKNRKNFEKKNIVSEDPPNVIAEDSIADNTEKLAITAQDSYSASKGNNNMLENAENGFALEHRSSKKTETSTSADARKVRPRDSLRVR